MYVALAAVNCEEAEAHAHTHIRTHGTLRLHLRAGMYRAVGNGESETRLSGE